MPFDTLIDADAETQDEVPGMPGHGYGPNGLIFRYNPDGTMGPVVYDPIAAQQAAAQQALVTVNNSGVAGAYDLGGTNANAPVTPPPPSQGFPGLLGGTAGPPPEGTYVTDDPLYGGGSNQPVGIPPDPTAPDPVNVIPDPVLNPADPGNPGYAGLPGSGGTGGTGTGTGTGTGGTGTGTGTGTSTGTTTILKPKYSELMARWRAANPNNQNPSGDEFNTWAATQDDVIAHGGKWDDDGDEAFGPQAGPQNYNQTQTGNQTGAFNTANTTNNTANQTSGGTTQSNTTGTVNNSNTGQTTQNTAQGTTGGQTGTFDQNTTDTTTGQTTTGVTDTLGFGGLLQGAAGSAQANDATRNAFLTDMVNTGGSAFGSQLDQGIRNSLTGPQMTGAGDSARARASGYAAAQVARNNTDQRLQAAGQLGGPTALSNLSTAANPYLGQTQSTTGTQTRNTTGQSAGTNFSNLISSSTGTSSNVGSQTSNQNTTGSTTGFQNLVGTGSENTSGTASGGSTSQASGQIPQAQQVSTGGGGCVLCTAGIELGLWNCIRVLRTVIAHKLSTPRFLRAQRGYFFLFTPVAVFLLRHPRLARFLAPLARAVVYEELRIAGRKLPRRAWAWWVHWTGHGICAVVGCFPVSGRVTSATIERIARRHGIWFNV